MEEWQHQSSGRRGIPGCTRAEVVVACVCTADAFQTDICVTVHRPVFNTPGATHSRAFISRKRYPVLGGLLRNRLLAVPADALLTSLCTSDGATVPPAGQLCCQGDVLAQPVADPFSSTAEAWPHSRGVATQQRRGHTAEAWPHSRGVATQQRRARTAEACPHSRGVFTQ